MASSTYLMMHQALESKSLIRQSRRYLVDQCLSWTVHSQASILSSISMLTLV
ncbi:hypothetical protein BVRB_9g220240 [Beta vulgaris subsp. vulgaris]|nr:hypothetical protein BVRB_9g220240 [Beta vulgaris subsp. vulgaris]